jgi:SAM-dependent methyltransferase
MDRQAFVSGSAQEHDGERASLGRWFATPLGRHVLEWEQAQFDHATEDVFGYRAVQVGLPEIDFLRANRIRFRFLLALEHGASVVADPLQMPLATQSIDLLALPHVLESHANPHDVLHEADRVLRPGGQVVIAGFNTLSLWRLRQMFTFGERGAPWDGRFIGLLQLKDWLRLLGFELNGGRFGLYGPPFARPELRKRFAFLEPAGGRWWPIMGGAYVVRAVKCVHGMRVITPAWRKERARRRALAGVPQRNGPIRERRAAP